MALTSAPPQDRPWWLVHLPNLISVARLVFAPIIIALILDRNWPGVFVCFVIAGLSDAVDGFIAKRFALTSELGAHLDAVADKALLISIYVALATASIIPAWLTLIVASRDIMIVAAVLIAFVLGRPMAIRPLWISKANTTVQIVFAAAVLASLTFALKRGLAFEVAIWLVAALTLASAAVYLARWLDHMSR